MSLILIYSSAFVFVTAYAKKAMLPSELPPRAELYKPAPQGENVPQNTVAPPAPEPKNSESMSSESEAAEEYVPVEYIVNKARAGLYPMLEPEATAVSEDIAVTTSPTTEATTAPTEKKAPKTTTEASEKPKSTKALETEAPETISERLNEEESENVEDNQDIDEEEGEEPEDLEEEERIDEEEEDGDNVELSENGEVVEELSPEELEELLERLAGGSQGPDNSWHSSGDTLISGNSYKNQTVTIYDTKQKRMRTDNAFDLVCEITNYEIGDSFEREATKAQAVAIYTYIKYYEQKGEYAELGTKSDVPDYIRECVEEVDGLAMFYDGKYIMAPFSASTGGYSAASKNVWGGDLPYLQSVKNDFDQLDAKNYGKVTTYTVDEVRSKIESKTDIRLSDNYSEWIRILSTNDYIYAGQLSIDGHTEAYINGKTRTITGHIFRTYVLNIRSTAFTVSYANGIFTFTTYGYGHGVGLAQVGANLYAKYGGYSFDQILHHYFTGITIQ